MPWFHQVDLEALRFQQLEQSNPVDTGGFQSDRLDAALLQPRDDLLKIGGVGAELADRVGVAVGGDADHMHVGMHIDSGRVRVDDMQRRRRNGDGDGKRPRADFLGWAGVLGLVGLLGWAGVLGSSFGTTMDVSGSRMRVLKQQGNAQPRGVSGTLEVSPTGSIPRRENPAGKSPMTRSKPLGPSFASGRKHQREYGH